MHHTAGHHQTDAFATVDIGVWAPPRSECRGSGHHEMDRVADDHDGESLSIVLLRYLAALL